MKISPSLFIGLGKFGSILSSRNHEMYNHDNPDLIKLHASISICNELKFRSSNDDELIVSEYPFLEEDEFSFKNNFKILNKDVNKLEDLIDKGLKYIYNMSNSLEVLRKTELHDKRKIIIYLRIHHI